MKRTKSRKPHWRVDVPREVTPPLCVAVSDLPRFGLSLSRTVLNRLAREGELVPLEITSGRLVYMWTDLVAFLEKRRSTAQGDMARRLEKARAVVASRESNPNYAASCARAGRVHSERAAAIRTAKVFRAALDAPEIAP